MIFVLCGKSAANVPFGLVFVEHAARLTRKGGVDLRKTEDDVFVDGRLADREHGGRLTHGTAGLRDLFAQTDGSFFDLGVHENDPPKKLLPHARRRLMVKNMHGET